MTNKISHVFLSAEYDLENPVGPDKGYTDVIVVLENGEKHVASFFSFQSVGLLRRQHQESGAFLSGKYFWAAGMVLIEDCSRASIEEVIRELMEEGDFWEVFRRI